MANLRVNRTGQKFGKLTVLSRAANRQDHKGIVWYKVRCDCGVEKEIRAGNLKRTESCGCVLDFHRKYVLPYICRKVAVGEKHGHLTILHPTYRTCKTKNKIRYLYWVCKCDCGKLVEKTSSQLRNSQRSRSCGCVSNAGNNMLKFSDITIKAIRTLYDNEVFTVTELAKQFGIGVGYISLIVHRKRRKKV